MLLRQASAFIVTYPVNNAIDKEGNYSKKAVAWEKAFIQLVKVCMLYYVPFTNDSCYNMACKNSRKLDNIFFEKMKYEKRKLDNKRNH